MKEVKELKLNDLINWKTHHFIKSKIIPNLGSRARDFKYLDEYMAKYFNFQYGSKRYLDIDLTAKIVNVMMSSSRNVQSLTEMRYKWAMKMSQDILNMYMSSGEVKRTRRGKISLKEGCTILLFLQHASSKEWSWIIRQYDRVSEKYDKLNLTNKAMKKEEIKKVPKWFEERQKMDKKFCEENSIPWHPMCYTPCKLMPLIDKVTPTEPTEELVKPLIEDLEAIVKGDAFSGENGRIWDHWLRKIEEDLKQFKNHKSKLLSKEQK